MTFQIDLNAIQVLTALLAIYGALLSTYTFWATRRDKRRRVDVAISFGFLTLPQGLSPEMMLIKYANPGHVTVTINSPGLELPDGRTLAFFRGKTSDVTFPHALEPGKGCTIWNPAGDLVEQLVENGFSGTVRLVPFCRDQIGTTFKGKRYDFDLAYWRKRALSGDSA